MANTQTVPARRGAATIVRHGQKIKIINTHGNQVVDTWALALPSSGISTASTKAEAPLYPSDSSSKYSNAANAAASAIEYMSMCHCRASLLKITPSVGDVLVSQKRAPMVKLIEDTSPGVHDTLIAACDPFNLFMNIPITQEGSGAKRGVSFEGPLAKEGDYVVLEARRDVVVVMSACPQDVLTINGKNPVDAHYQVVG